MGIVFVDLFDVGWLFEVVVLVGYGLVEGDVFVVVDLYVDLFVFE